MRLLLDTHVFLWLISGDARLSALHRDTITDPANTVFLSVASTWEVIIKYQLGKLPLPEPAEIYLPAQRRAHQIASLDIDEETVIQVASLPPLHRDPFDRILIAQALRHNLTIVTVDAAVQSYSVPTL